MKFAATLVLLALFLVGCATHAATSDFSSASVSAHTFSTASAFSDADRGDMHFKIEEPSKLKYQQWHSAALQTSMYQDTINYVNQDVALPRDVPVTLKQCDELASYYDYKTQEIVACYEMFARFNSLFDKQLESRAAAQEATLQSMQFIFAHELGHAVIDQLQVPFTGREEDVADQYATMLLLQNDPNGGEVAIKGAEIFLLQGKDEGNVPLWGDHSLDDQRYYNILCWVYGSDTDKYSYIVDDEMLPSKRAKRCEREYTRIVNSWDTLLAPYKH